MGLLDGEMAGLIGTGLVGAGMTKPATLHVITPSARTPGAVSAGTNPYREDFTARGLVVTWNRLMLNQTQVMSTDRVVLLLGATLKRVPAIGNAVTIEGATSRIVDIQRDPASAGYSLLTRGAFALPPLSQSFPYDLPVEI